MGWLGVGGKREVRHSRDGRRELLTFPGGKNVKKN